MRGPPRHLHLSRLPNPEALVRRFSFIALVALVPTACLDEPDVDLILRGGTIYDGSGGPGFVGDVAMAGDSIVSVGDIGALKGVVEEDVSGLAVAPGFINMLSWATESLLEDGLAQSDVRQGVTLEVFGEGESMGPLNEQMKDDMLRFQGDIEFDITWTTLGEYLEHLEAKGVSVNVASFIGATTVRVHELGYENRAPTDEESARMQDLVREAMREGAMGVGSSLIYAPAFYADTPELVSLTQAAAEFGGIYISHIRSEGNALLESVDELIHVARETGAPAEIYHLKAAGQSNWSKMDEVINKVEAARADGLRITADMYTYTAGATGLDAAMPPWVQEGGYDTWAERLQDPDVRSRVLQEMSAETDAWENLALAAGTPDRILLVGFKADSLKHLTGLSLAEVSAIYGTSWQETAMDLVIKDGSRVGTVYFMMSEENIRKQIALPWVSFDSDAGALATREPFTLSNPHPRAYGNFARVLGRYVREEGALTLAEAVRKLSALPAENLGLRRRGQILPGHYADIAVFDPVTVTDHATFEEPHQYSTGMVHVFVNGVRVLEEGQHTGATPGRVVRGPGWTGWDAEVR
jgi:N-acyl-D-amino-acid deacylase